jgi:cell division protein FtsB
MKHSPRVGKIRLGSHHALVMGHCPTNLKLDELSAKLAAERREITQFGLFDSAAPNLAHYFPDVTKEDLNPDLDKEAFIYPIYRGLSEVVVHKKYNPIDFGQGGVLKDSMQMLVAQAVYANHEAIVGNELGSIPEVSWQEAYTTNKGVKVPAGINTKLMLDGKSNPKIARMIMMKPPAIHSVSVTVSFQWEPSHAFTSDNDFWHKLGTIAEDGQLVRRIVTKVLGYHEISLVSHGADPYAQIINEDGLINNPDYADRVMNSTAETPGKTQNYFSFDYRVDTIENSETPPTTPVNLNPNPNEETMKSLLLALCAMFPAIKVDGLDETQLQAQLTQEITKLSTSSTTLAADLERLKAEATTHEATLTQLKADKTALETQVESLKAENKIPVDELRASVTELLNKLHENKAPEALVASLASTNKDGLVALKASYEAQLEERYPLHCEDCQGENVSRRSSVENGGGDKGKTKPAITKSFTESAKHFRQEAQANTVKFMDDLG